jgi:hypothetical protein
MPTSAWVRSVTRQVRSSAEPPIWSVAVVIPGLEDLHLFVVGTVDEPVFVVDAAERGLEMIDHIYISVTDIEKSLAFYR